MRAAGIPYRGVTKPRELVSLQVEIDPVMDLTDPNVSPIPTSSPFLTGDLPQELDDCRTLADYLRAQGFSGIITPSAALSKQKNLIIYYDGIASNLDIDFGGDRIPL